MPQIESALPSCNCQDLRFPAFVFAGVLVATAALCGTFEMNHVIPLDKVDVADNENVIGPVDIDPAAVDCQNKRAGESLSNPRIILASAGGASFASLHKQSGQCAKKSARKIH